MYDFKLILRKKLLDSTVPSRHIGAKLGYNKGKVANSDLQFSLFQAYMEPQALGEVAIMSVYI